MCQLAQPRLINLFLFFSAAFLFNLIFSAISAGECLANPGWSPPIAEITCWTAGGAGLGCESQIRNFHDILSGYHEVLWLEVMVDKDTPVNVLQAQKKLDAHLVSVCLFVSCFSHICQILALG